MAAARGDREVPSQQGVVRPTVVSVERQINLDFMTAAPAPVPQQNFSVEWTGWLRVNRDGPYAFDLRSDDGSSFELDGRVIVDASKDVLFPTHRAATVALSRGLHQVRVRFLQTDGGYEFYTYWTPPGEADLAPFPTQQLFVKRQPALILFLTRHVLLLWALCWFALAAVNAPRIARTARDTAAGRRAFARVTAVMVSTMVAALAAEGTIRLARYLRAGPAAARRTTARRPRSPGVIDANAAARRDCSGEPLPRHRLRAEARRPWTVIGQPLQINSQGLRD